MLVRNSNTMQCFIIETSSQTKKTRTGWGPWGGRYAVRGEGQGDGGWRWEHVGNSIQSRAVCWRSLRSAIRFAPLRGERAVCSRAGSVGRTNHWRKNYWTDGDGCTLVSFRTLSACLSKFPNSLCIRLLFSVSICLGEQVWLCTLRGTGCRLTPLLAPFGWSPTILWVIKPRLTEGSLTTSAQQRHVIKLRFTQGTL